MNGETLAIFTTLSMYLFGIVIGWMAHSMLVRRVLMLESVPLVGGVWDGHRVCACRLLAAEMELRRKDDSTAARYRPSLRRRQLELALDDCCTLAPDLDVRDCCRLHDAAYDSGAQSRFAADRDLLRCIAARKPQLIHWPIAAIYFVGVRAFGWMFWRACRRKDSHALPSDSHNRN